MSGASTRQVVSSLMDFTSYRVSVTCKLIYSIRNQYAFVAGPVIATTQEAGRKTLEIN